MLRKEFGNFGGAYVDEAQLVILKELEDAFNKYKDDEDFINELNYYLKDFVGRETPLYYAKKLSDQCGGGKIYLKREDLNHTGAHKINNVLGQVLLAKRMGKTKLIAETGAGQHGVATATVAALMGMECTVYMGVEDMRRQSLNVARMEMLGATVVPATSGTQTLKEAVDEAIEAWISASSDTFYVLGSAVGPYPYPSLVKYFQQVISIESRKQILEKEGRLPKAIIACVGGGSNAIGSFAAYIEDKEVELIGIEAAGLGVDTNKHAATIAKGKEVILHGMRTYCVLDENDEVAPVYSISAGLDYPGIGPEHAYLFASGRASYEPITDKESIDALILLNKLEGILPAIESAHAIAYATKYAKTCSKDDIIIVTLSGRGDKDLDTVIEYLKENK